LSQPTLADHALALLLGVVVPLAGVLRHQPAMKAATYDRAARAAVAWNGALSLAILGLATLGAWWYREGSLAGLGLGPPRAHVGPALALSLAFVTAYALLTWWHLRPARLAESLARWERDTPFMPRELSELPPFCVLALAAGVFEEIAYRGLLVSYLAWYTGPSLPMVALAVTLPAAVFAFAHLYQGLAAVVMVAAMATAFGAIYLLTQSLWILIALHTALDLFGGWLGVRVIQSAAKSLRSDASP
jgi:membrane protease YdiL (CAAX protease family)